MLGLGDYMNEWGYMSPSGTDWTTVLGQGINAASGILGTRYAVPQLAPGQYFSQTPGGGMTTFQNPSGGGAFSMPMAGGSSLLLYGGLALAAILLISRGR